MTTVFSIRFTRSTGLRHLSRRRNFLVFLLLAGGMFCPASRAYAISHAGERLVESRTTEQLQQADSVRTLFSGTLLFSSGNGDWIEHSEYIAVGRFLRAAQKHPETEIRLTGWTDTTGTAAFNRQLSQKRAAAVGRYLVRKGIAADRIRTEGRGVDFAAATPRQARRVEMRGVITPPHRNGREAPKPSDNPIDNGFSAKPEQSVTTSSVTGAAQAETARTTCPVADASAGQIKADTTARSVAAQTAPTSEDSTRQTPAAPDRSPTRLASTTDDATGSDPAEHAPIPSASVSDSPHAAAEQVQSARKPAAATSPDAQPSAAQQDADLQSQSLPETKLVQTAPAATTLAGQQTFAASPERRAANTEFHATNSEPAPATRYLGVKTNLAAWTGTIMNVAADVQVGCHWSVELPVLWCPWYVSDKHAVKTFTIQPEGRYWLSKPGEGHFFGVHAHMGWFSVKWNRDRYQDTERPLLGVGISYGYLVPFTEHWAGEFTLGAGYANMKYDTYYNIDNGARIDTRTKNYWGITRVGISVVYRFNLKK